jgi:hypothetical protein
MAATAFPLLSRKISVRVKRGTLFGILILAALLAFEIFNFSSTSFALADLLGDLRFWGVPWATILAVAFCGIDFAGIARLFTPEEGEERPAEAWYLFAAWLLAATMNAVLTWWGVSIAVFHQDSLGSAVVARATLLRVAPVFVAVLVWLMRVLIIGTFSVAGGRLFTQDDKQVRWNPLPSRHSARRSAVRSSRPAKQPAPSRASRVSRGASGTSAARCPRPEPTYEPLAAQGKASSRSSMRPS